jgi:sporulation protein YabP
VNREDGEKISYGNAVIENRRSLTLTGVSNIISFDESSAILDSQYAVISVDGEDLQIMKMDMDSGEVVITGKINVLAYSDKKQGAKRLGAFFKGGRHS